VCFLFLDFSKYLVYLADKIFGSGAIGQGKRRLGDAAVGECEADAGVGRRRRLATRPIDRSGVDRRLLLGAPHQLALGLHARRPKTEARSYRIA
jgi:hypothetical protein